MQSKTRRWLVGLGAIAAIVVACSRSAKKPRTAVVMGPQLGESTAAGPSDTDRPPPDAPDEIDISVPISPPRQPVQQQPQPQQPQPQPQPQPQDPGEGTPTAPIPPVHTPPPNEQNPPAPQPAPPPPPPPGTP